MARPLKRKAGKLARAIRPLGREEKLDWIRLIQTENVGPISFYQLLERFGSVDDALKNLPRVARAAGRQSVIRIPSRMDALRMLEKYEAKGVALLASVEPDYPRSLANLNDAPPLLSAVGRLELLNDTLFSVVGSRNASALGREMAFQMAKRLAEEGFVIVSGLAEGIDTAAHRGALDAGTVAVVAGGVDRFYPPSNRALQRAIEQQGVVISEAFLGTEPLAGLFPRRNRLISGLAWGVLVVEAAFKSGSLLTAHYAAEQGRQVFSVPGHPKDSRAQGTNRLIQDGAILVQMVQDILDHKPKTTIEEDLFDDAYLAHYAVTYSEEQLAQIKEQLLNLLTHTPTSLSSLSNAVHFPEHLIGAVLLDLVLAGRVTEHYDGMYSKSL